METCLLDLGNTCYKWLRDADGINATPQRRTYVANAPEAAVTRGILATGTYGRLVVASVRGKAFDQALTKAFLSAGGKEVVFARVPETPSFKLAYARPETFGVDRYLHLLAARDEYPLPLIVVSAGTAVTIDAMDATGAHLGGIIYPGLGLLKHCLVSGTRLVTADDNAPVELFGHSTEAGVNGGAFHGLRAAVAGIVGQMTQTITQACSIIVTGGDAEVLLPALQSGVKLDSNLLFKGLRKI